MNCKRFLPFAIAILGFMGMTFVVPAHAKYRVCTVTINSKEEVETFKSSLNPSDFVFTELTTVGPNSGSNVGDAWFNRACEAGIQCDVLVVSGHFGGQFSGSSELTWSLNKMEEVSCRKSCHGILGKPKEVFLFGCNTLGTKGKEARTPQEYLRVLIDHVGLSHQEAARLVAAQYGPFGSSFKDRIERVFEGVDVIYGFDGVGPSGPNVKSSLANYFRRIGDYKTHLDSLPSRNDKIWLESMRAYNRDIGQGLRADHPTHHIKDNMCRLNDNDQLLSERLALAVDLLTRDPMLYLPSVSQFASRSLGEFKFGQGDDRALVEGQLVGLSGRQDLRQYFESTYHAGGMSPSVKVDLLVAERNFSWISKDEFTARMEKLFAEYSASPSATDADFLCSQIEETKSFIQYFNGQHLQVYGYDRGPQFRVLGCAATKAGPGVMLKALQGYQRVHAKMTIEDRANAIIALLKLPLQGFEKPMERILRDLLSYKGHMQNEVRIFAAERLLRFAKGQEQISLSKELLSRKNPNLYGLSESIGLNAQPEDSVILGILAANLRSPSVGFFHEKFLTRSTIWQDWMTDHVKEYVKKENGLEMMVPVIIATQQKISNRLKELMIEIVEQNPFSGEITLPYDSFFKLLDQAELNVEDLRKLLRFYHQIPGEKWPKVSLRHILFKHGRGRIDLDPTILTGEKYKAIYSFGEDGSWVFSGVTYFTDEPSR